MKYRVEGIEYLFWMQIEERKDKKGARNPFYSCSGLEYLIYLI